MPVTAFKWFKVYDDLIRERITTKLSKVQSEVNNWQDRLFVNFLIYCFPASLIAVIPCVYISFKQGYEVIGSVDVGCFFAIAAITLTRSVALKMRKVAVIALFYLLAIFLTATLGYVGPGVFYLFAITILCSLIFPIRFAWYSIATNAVIILCFALFIYLRPHTSVLGSEYTAAQWLAFSSNLVFLSILLVVLVDKIFTGLQSVITSTAQMRGRYQSIFESSPLPMWVFDINTLEFLDVNEAAIKQYGYTRDEFLSMTIREIRPEEYRNGIEHVVKLNRDTTKFHHGNIIHLKKNGDQINVKIESNLLDYNGRAAKLVLANDITVQVKSQEAIQRSNMLIRQSEANLRAIFDSSTEGFMLLDIDHNIVVFNTKASESGIFNKGAGDFAPGKNIFDFVEDRNRKHFSGILQSVHNGHVAEYDQNFEMDCETRWIHFTITPVSDGGVIAGACITGRDITERKKYVQTIEEQNKKFREISWIQSHLVRAPLARVMGLSTLLASETSEKEKAEMLELLQQASSELDTIIRDITDKSLVTDKIRGFSTIDF